MPIHIVHEKDSARSRTGDATLTAVDLEILLNVFKDTGGRHHEGEVEHALAATGVPSPESGFRARS